MDRTEAARASVSPWPATWRCCALTGGRCRPDRRRRRSCRRRWRCRSSTRSALLGRAAIRYRSRRRRPRRPSRAGRGCCAGAAAARRCRRLRLRPDRPCRSRARRRSRSRPRPGGRRRQRPAPASKRPAARLGNDIFARASATTRHRRARPARRADDRHRPPPASPRRSRARSSPVPTARSIRARAPSGSSPPISLRLKPRRLARGAATGRPAERHRPREPALCAAGRRSRASRSFVDCSPLRGLPAELYDVPGGWSNFIMNYRMPG